MSSSNQSQTLQEDPNDLLNIHTITIHEVFSSKFNRVHVINNRFAKIFGHDTIPLGFTCISSARTWPSIALINHSHHLH